MHPLGLNFSSLDCSLTEKGFLRNRHEEVIGWLYFCHILLLELKSKSWDVRVTIRFRFIKESDKKRTLLMGFTDDFKVQIFLFLLFLAIYFFTMIGNLGLVFLVIMDSQLHNPIYSLWQGYHSWVPAILQLPPPKSHPKNHTPRNKTIYFLGCGT